MFHLFYMASFIFNAFKFWWPYRLHLNNNETSYWKGFISLFFSSYIFILLILLLYPNFLVASLQFDVENFQTLNRKTESMLITIICNPLCTLQCEIRHLHRLYVCMYVCVSRMCRCTRAPAMMDDCAHAITHGSACWMQSVQSLVITLLLLLPVYSS